jgi:hypothetical protein
MHNDLSRDRFYATTGCHRLLEGSASWKQDVEPGDLQS